jgi:hypothetical protein
MGRDLKEKVAGTGNGEAVVVRDALRALGHENAYLVPVATWLCEEPVVIESKGWERESLQADGAERGKRELAVHVCCDDPGDAETTARSLAVALALYDWAQPGFDLPEDIRPISCNTARPSYQGRDTSGRWLWDVPLTMTVVIENA